MADDVHEPVLGVVRARSSRIGIGLAGGVRAVARMKGYARSGVRHRLARIGRGAAIAHLIMRAPPGTRRSNIWTRSYRLAGPGLKRASEHLRYLKRDGVGRDGSRGTLYSASEDDVEAKQFMARCRADRHQFRIAVSSDDAAEYEDLKPFVRRLMQQVERDLDTRLEWVAVDHFDTATPHSHIVLRGVDDKGKDLIIAREYLYQGMRLRSEQLLSIDLGPRTTLEVCRHISHDPAAERLTELDVILSRSAGPDGTVFPHGRDGVDRSFQLARLEKLEQMGLADRIRGGRWQLAGSFGDVLREMGERGNIIRTMQQALTSGGISRRYSDLLIYRSDMGRIVGQALEVHAACAYGSQNALIVDAVDGRTYYLAIGVSLSVDHISTGAIVSIQPAHPPDAAPRLHLMSPLPLKSLPGHEGATWLDQIIGPKASLSVRDAGFGRDVRKALDLRREWLVANGHALGEGKNVIFQPGALEALRRRELHSVIEQVERETGLKAVHPIPGDPVEGKILRRIDMGPGMFAAVGNDRQFSIHPWSSALERQLEKQISFPGLELRSSWPIRTRDISI